MNKFKLFLFFILVVGLSSCNQQTKKSSTSEVADAIYFGGDIITMEGKDVQYAEAVAIKDGKIIFVGAKSEAENYHSNKTLMKDLAGKTLLPGFLDAHSHYFNSLTVANQCKLYAPPSALQKM